MSSSSVCRLFFLFVSVLFVLPGRPRGQICYDPSPPPEKPPDQSGVGRLFSISTEGPMTDILTRDKAFMKAMTTLQKHVEHVEASIRRMLQPGNRLALGGNPLTPCTHDGNNFKKPTETLFGRLRLPIPDYSCISELSGAQTFAHEAPPFSVSQIADALNDYWEGQDRNVKEIADRILGNWSTPHANYNYEYIVANKKCNVNAMRAYRVGPKWHLGVAVQNAPKNLFLPLFKRQTLAEYIHISDYDTLKTEPLRMNFPIRPKGDGVHVNETETTTSLGSGIGVPGPFGYTPIVAENNPAVILGMQQSDHGIQQADDVLSLSGVSIVALPLTLNLLPIAAVADVTTRTMLLYTLASDVVTVLPLMIKGVELMVIAGQRHKATLMVMNSAGDGTLSEAAAMIMWTADCVAETDFLPAGVSFVVVALVFMALGVFLELVTLRSLRRRKLVAQLLDKENEPMMKQGLDDGQAGVSYHSSQYSYDDGLIDKEILQQHY